MSLSRREFLRESALAGAAVGVGEGTEERVEVLVEAGVDVVVVDTAHGHSKNVLSRVKWVKRQFPKTQVIGGNLLKVLSWYDNEYGYSMRTADLIARLAKL